MPPHHRRVARAPFDGSRSAGSIHIHVRDDLVDPEKMYIRTEKMRLIGRMHGRGWYARTSDLFLMDRLDLESWEANKR
jgi:hypothetical protein